MPKKPVLITTPFPTLEETAKLYGVPKKRLKEIVEMVKEFQASEAAAPAKKHRTAKRKPTSP